MQVGSEAVTVLIQRGERKPMSRWSLGLTVLILLAAYPVRVSASEGVGDSRDRRPLRVVLFVSETCSECRRTKAILPKIEKRWAGRIVVEMKSLRDLANVGEWLRYDEHYGSTAARVPGTSMSKSMSTR